MTTYRVEAPFEAFQREYKIGTILSDAELECWQPDICRASMMVSLAAKGSLSIVSDAAEQAAELAEQHVAEAEKALADAQVAAAQAEAAAHV